MSKTKGDRNTKFDLGVSKVSVTNKTDFGIVDPTDPDTYYELNKERLRELNETARSVYIGRHRRERR